MPDVPLTPFAAARPALPDVAVVIWHTGPLQISPWAKTGGAYATEEAMRVAQREKAPKVLVGVNTVARLEEASVGSTLLEEMFRARAFFIVVPFANMSARPSQRLGAIASTKIDLFVL